MSISEMMQLLRNSSDTPVVSLLCEALTSAAEEIIEEQQWDAAVARELVTLHVGRRITPKFNKK
ncbi:hypothetical protein [Leucobacter denitrificans]|uniref:hypothetical protein n=1 Tax=Leucobacter denitrificans TaxID=683042 RepID=UPI0036196045